MEMQENLTGRFAVSRAGHDKGRLYVVLAADERSMTLADGNLRKLASPKAKNRRHVQLTNASLSPKLLTRLREGTARDEELNRELRIYDKKIKKDIS